MASKFHNWLNNTDEPGVLFCSTCGCKNFTSSRDGKTYVLIQTDSGSLRWVAQPSVSDQEDAENDDGYAANVQAA